MSPISNASRLADFGSGIGTQGAVIQVDNTNQRVGIGTTNPQAMLQVGTAISMFGSTGIVSATTFYGSGEGLTGVASTDYIITGTAATFNNQVQIGTALTIGYAGVATFSGAGGIGVTITPSTGKVEASEIRANEFYGDGSNLEGVSASGLGTGLNIGSDGKADSNLPDDTPLQYVFKAARTLHIGAGTSVRVDSDATSGNIAFMREADTFIGAGATFTIGAGTSLISDALGIFKPVV